MGTGLEWIEKAAGNAIIVLLITLLYKFSNRKKKKDNKYTSLDSLKEDVMNLIDVFKLLPLTFLMGAGESFISDDKNRIYIIFGVILIYWFAIKFFLQWKRKKNFQSNENRDEGELVKKLITVYKYDVEFERFFLRDKNVWIAKTITISKWFCFAAFTAFYDFYSLLEIGGTIAVYPVVVILLLSEVDAYFSGYTLDNYCGNFYHNKSVDIRKPNMLIISDKITSTLSKYKLKIKNESREYDHNDISVQWDTMDYEYSLLKGFLDNQKYDKRRLKYLVNPTINILKKQNVIFNTYFYRDLDIAVFFPMMLAIFNGKKGIFVIDTENIDREVKWIENTFGKMCGVHKFIKCSKIEDANGAEDVIVLNFKDFLNWDKNPIIKSIARKIDLLFFVEPSSQTMQELNEINNIKIYINDIGGNANVVISDSHQEIVDKIMLTTDSKTIYRGPYALKPYQYTVIWLDADGEDTKEFDSSDVEVNIIRILTEELKEGEIIWVNKDKRASVDLWWRFQKHLEKSDVITLKHVTDGRNLELSKEACFIIEDSEYNYLSTAERFLPRAEEKGFMCVMVPDYLLRNYMIHNQNIEKSIMNFIMDKIIPEPIESENNAIIKLVKKLYETPVESGAIFRELCVCNADEAWVNNCLSDLINKYLNISSARLIKENGYAGRSNDKYIIGENPEIVDFLNKEKAIAVYEGEKKLAKLEKINYCNVYQKYLPGQSIVFQGMRYIIAYIGLNGEEYIIRLRRSLDNVGKREYYRQKRRYYLSGLQDREDGCVNNSMVYGNIIVVIKYANVLCKTEGYIRSARFNHLFNGLHVEVNNIPERKYEKRNILQIELIKANPVIQIYFAILLKEILYSLCPENIDYLGIGVNILSDCQSEILEQYIDAGIVWKVEAENQNNACIYIIDDSLQETGIIQAIEKKMDLIILLILSYVNWCIKSKEDYLLFGGINIEQESFWEYLTSVKYYLEGKVYSDDGDIEQEAYNAKDNSSDRAIVRKNTEIVATKEEAEAIFAQVLSDMLHFRNLNINIPLYPAFKRKKRGYVLLPLNVTYKQFYHDSVYGIIKEYYQIMNLDEKEELFEQYANEYVDLMFSD